ncbi:uncharacterized protein LOC131061402 [Cryptomeria japonica]|uniref:uncharacterized protein LOC131061402 n=1 Tax=Cryptomeria japonica TaxID=3369 RepID=UPI0027DA644B|nr:uncharacterized protein LOC131061402 [Cryptomeria japonica]
MRRPRSGAPVAAWAEQSQVARRQRGSGSGGGRAAGRPGRAATGELGAIGSGGRGLQGATGGSGLVRRREAGRWPGSWGPQAAAGSPEVDSVGLLENARPMGAGGAAGGGRRGRTDRSNRPVSPVPCGTHKT